MSTRPLLFKYPLDLTGKSSTNLVSDEPRRIDGTVRGVFVPHGGPFYVQSLVVKDAANGTVLQPRLDYLVLQPYQEASVKSGLDVAGVIYVTKANVSEVLVTYQVVGGEFSWSAYALEDLISNLQIDDRPVAWGDILGKPNTFPPTPHLHDLGDTYGWEYIVTALEGIYRAILIGDEQAHEDLKRLFDGKLEGMKLYIDQRDGVIKSALDNHIGDKNNPHGTTKTHVGLDKVENFPPATPEEGVEGTASNRYMTPASTKAALDQLKNGLGNAATRDFFVSTTNPDNSKGKDGDIWIKHA